MQQIAWDEKMSVGVQALDEDHRQLVRMVNELYESILAEDAGGVLQSVLDRLTLYTVEHFRREEELFLRYGYPEAEAHANEHARLIAQVEKARKNFGSGGNAVLSLELINFLRQWLLSHIQGVDKKYGPFLNGHGVS